MKPSLHIHATSHYYPGSDTYTCFWGEPGRGVEIDADLTLFFSLTDNKIVGLRQNGVLRKMPDYVI